MRTNLTILLFIMALMFVRCTDMGSKAHDDTRELLSLERQWLEKEFDLDTAFLSTIMDSTFISISEDGIKNKNDDLVSMYNNISQRKQKGIEIDSFRLEDKIVNIYANTAVVTFIVHTFRHSSDTLIERTTRFYDVWINQGDEWKAVASQGTALKSESTRK